MELSSILGTKSIGTLNRAGDGTRREMARGVASGAS